MKHLIRLSVIVALCGFGVEYAAGANYTVTGTLEFMHDFKTQLRDFNQNGRIAFPKDTCIELVKKNWLGGWDVVVRSMTTNANGTYSITYDTDVNAEFRLRVSQETMKDLPNNKERINVNGQFAVPVVPEWNWWFETNTFTFANADPATLTFTVHLFVGNETDNDTAVVNHTQTMREMSVHNPWFVAYGEEEMRLMAGVLFAIDKAYLEIEQSGKIGWLGTMHGQDTKGQLVWCPGGLLGALAGAIAWPDNFHIHLDSAHSYAYWNAHTVAHEFGHVVHYHSTSWSSLDLIGEIWYAHNYWKETDTKVAYCEGWAEFFEAMFIDTQQATLIGTPSAYATTAAWIWAGVTAHPQGQLPTPANATFDGTDNSGEIVEGAVAQVMWNNSPPAAVPPAPPIPFRTRLEDVWNIVREGATAANNRNSRKTMEDFYDTWMSTYSGAGNAVRRQTFRDVCATRGIVYSRLWLKKVESVAGSGEFVKAEDKLWVSAKSKIQVEPMDKDDLMVCDVDETVVEVAFEVSKNPQNTPFVWANVPDAAVVGPANWTRFAKDTAGGGFWGLLDAGPPPAGQNLNNLYYIVRGRVIKEGDATIVVEDKLNGPVLHANDASGKSTAEWWELMRTTVWGTKVGIHHQIKVDKHKPKVNQRQPAAN